MPVIIVRNSFRTGHCCCTNCSYWRCSFSSKRGSASPLQAASAEGQANIRLRVGARIADPNTSDDAAFDCAKDGEAAIRALTGAAAAERRRMIGKRKRGGAFAFAGSF